jgi:isopenicillin N synthase-like dioxygenase
MIETTTVERKTWQSKPEISHRNEDKSLQIIASKSSEVEISEHLFNLIPCNSRLRYCVDVGTRNGENFTGNTLIAHSLLVSNDGKEDDQRQGHENFVNNDHKYSRDTWFGVLLQPDDRAFQSLKRLHEPLGNVCLQISPSVEDERSNCDESLECILGQHVSELPLDFDFLGLNEVGYGNYWLLRNFLGNSTYKPKVVCISYDNKRSNDVAYIPDQTNDQELPSIRAIIELMSCHDYQLAATTSRCCFFSTRVLYEGYLIGEPPTVSQYRNPIDDSYVEQEEKRESSESDHETKSDKIGLETSYSSNPTLSGNTMDDNNKQHSSQTKECDDFVCVSPNTSAAHQDIENAEFVGRRQTEAKETINTKHFKDERISQRFPAKLKKAVPPHPIRDTFILQKMKQNELTGDKSLEETRMESKNEIEIRKEAEKELATVFAVIQDSLSENMDGSVLDLENEMFKLLQDNKKEKADAIYEELGCASNGNDDDFLPMSVPTDLTALCGPTERSSQKERLECAKSLIAELRHKGHAMVCGTTISRFVCRDALYASHLMFYEADESVRISCKSENGILRGYSPKCTEQSGSSNLKDMVRKFRLGSEKGTTPNKWPVEGTLDEETDEYIRVSFQKYHDNLHRVAVLITKSIHEIISSDVTAPNNAHDPNAHDPNSSLLTLINCEHGSRHDTRKPLIAGHNDTSIVTILLVDGGDCANIQHESTEGKWENVRLPEVIPKDPVFMVYAGECLQKLSGGLIPSNSRRIVPCFGDQIVNGLSFSLMLSETHTSPFQNKEPTNAGHEDFQSPVSKPMCELNDVGEDFQSSVFSENGDFEHDSSFQENSEVTVDPFTQDLEDVRKMRRHHIEGSRSAKRNSRAIDQILSKYRNQSSKMGEFEGQEVEINEEIPINSCLESSRPGRNHFSTKLLGSPQLPIIIETQTKSARRTDSSAKKTIKIDENFKPMPPFPTCGKNAKRNCESIDAIKLLPVVSPRNPPRRELKELRNEYRKTYICTMNARKSSGGDNRTKDRFIGSRINVVHQINPVESSEASAILEEMLEYESDDHSNNVDRQMARARSRIKSDSKVVPSSSSQKYDEIFKTWRDSLSDNYTPFRGSVVELKMGEKAKKIQSSSSRWEKRGYRFGCGVAKQDP